MTTVREYKDAIKMLRGCVDCGYREHPAALDFDHVRGVKVGNLSAMTDIRKVQAEIAKCEVRCANCHRIVTYNRYQMATKETPEVSAKWVAEWMAPEVTYSLADLLAVSKTPRTTIQRHLSRHSHVRSEVTPGRATLFSYHPPR